MRVHEELVADGAALSYQALTAFCRRQGIGQESLAPTAATTSSRVSRCSTTPRRTKSSSRDASTAQTAAAVLCYSRMLYFEIWPQFQRFDCKAFLTEALRYLGGAPQRTMIDNTHVVVLRGSGKQMEPVPEMAAFAERMGFRFVAHEIGDANRSARGAAVPLHRTQLSRRQNLRELAGSQQPGAPVVRSRQRHLQETHSRRSSRTLRGRTITSETAARLDSGSLPLHQRIVDSEGYVALHSNRYSVPATFIGRRVEVRETREKIDIELDARRIVTHTRLTADQRVTLSEHRPPRGEGLKRGTIQRNKRSSTPRPRSRRMWRT